MRIPSYIRRLSYVVPPLLKVKRSERTMVLPEKSTPRELKPLSFIDNTNSMMFQAPILMLYKHKSSMTGTDPVNVIREALAKALVPYYPFAGRLVEGPNSGLMVDCTSEGVAFIEAESDAKVNQVIDTMMKYGGNPPIDELLQDFTTYNGILGCPLWLFQVTRFRCGGFALALRFNHAMTDGSGVGQFLNAMVEFARGAKNVSLPPVWKRDELFLPREPPRLTCQHVELEEIENISPQATAEYKNNMISRLFYFGSEYIRALKNRLQNQHGKTYTTFEVVTACLWRSQTRALELDPGQVVQLSCLANARNQNDLEVPPGYYGNALAIPSVITMSKTLCTNPLDFATDLVKKAKGKMSGEYLRSCIDTMVSRGLTSLPAKPWMFIVSDTRGLGIDEADFGWGNPIFCCYAKADVMRCRYTRYKDGVIIPMCLPEKVMGRFENELKKIILEEEPVA